ncbi:MAG: urease accessory protein UreH [candidate division NC10 bacterium]|nr:urease accessory protein UreH [candidate division NC10 bacterium]
MDTSLLPALGLGFLLGLTHALDADHVAAVGTLVSETAGLRRSSLLGASWGIGHSASLLAAGLLVLGLRLAIPPGLSAAAEFAVGLMLVGLGARAIWSVLRERRLHWHAHEHDGFRHLHLHAHASAGRASHDHIHPLCLQRRPFLIGCLHGLAGSGPLTLLVLGTLSSPLAGLAYLGLFSLGSIAGMSVLSGLLSFPMAYAVQRGAAFGGQVRMVAGAISLVLGLGLAGQIVSGGDLLGQG